MLNKILHLYCKTGIANAPHGTIRYALHQQLRKVHMEIKRREELKKRYPFWVHIIDKNISAYGTITGLSYQLNLCPSQKIKFDLRQGIEKGNAKGIALVFFMGMGDYLFTTPLLAALRREFPSIPIHAYASNNWDSTNSPQVGKLLERDPNIDKVIYYNGKRSAKQRHDWRNYDYADAIEKAPDDFLVVPVVYHNNSETRHRVFALFHAFSLEKPRQPLVPLLHTPTHVPEHVVQLASHVAGLVKKGRKGIVGLQLEARSSNYVYPYGDQLAQKFVNLGLLVLSFSPLTIVDENIVVVDLKKFSIMDSIQLLALLHREHQESLKLVTVTSVFGSVSAALNIKNMQMWHFEDESLHALWFPNIHIIAHRDYPAVPPENITVFHEAEYKRGAASQCHYLPDPLVKVFLKIYES